MRGSVPQGCDFNYSYPETGIVIWNETRISNRDGSLFLICDASVAKPGAGVATS